MRTTVTLDPDVAAEIEHIRTTEGRRFKHVLNDALRLGLKQLSGAAELESPASPTEPEHLGHHLVDVTRISEVIAEAEGADHR